MTRILALGSWSHFTAEEFVELVWRFLFGTFGSGGTIGRRTGWWSDFIGRPGRRWRSTAPASGAKRGISWGSGCRSRTSGGCAPVWDISRRWSIIGVSRPVRWSVPQSWLWAGHEGKRRMTRGSRLPRDHRRNAASTNPVNRSKGSGSLQLVPRSRVNTWATK